jgi:hypothetical protein
MSKLNPLLKLNLSLLLVLLLALLSTYLIINLTKEFTTNKKIHYSSWEYFTISDIQLNSDTKLHFTLKQENGSYSLFSDVGCSITQKEISTIKNKKVSFQMKNIEFKNIFYTAYKKEFYVLNDVRNVFCKQGYEIIFIE